MERLMCMFGSVVLGLASGLREGMTKRVAHFQGVRSPGAVFLYPKMVLPVKEKHVGVWGKGVFSPQ